MAVDTKPSSFLWTMFSNLRNLTMWFAKTVYKSFVWSGFMYTIPIDICLVFGVRLFRRLARKGEVSIADK